MHKQKGGHLLGGEEVGYVLGGGAGGSVSPGSWDWKDLPPVIFLSTKPVGYLTGDWGG